MNVRIVSRVFDKARMEADAVVAALPANIDIHDEVAMIEAAYSPVTVLAKWIAGLPVETRAGEALKLRAKEWLDDH